MASSQTSSGDSHDHAQPNPLPAIALPKGGGSIRGIGEKFSVNAATGTSGFSLPIVASPGRSGFGPELSLSYESGAGNGPFGFGWSLSLPSITRKTDKGLPRYRDGDESDVFLISGAEDLVPILDSQGKPICLDRTLHQVAYSVRLYRPRIEGLFARIERWTTGDGISHWRSITRDNVTTLFGVDPNSQIVDPNDARRIFSYLIALTFDDKGNVARYCYVAEDSTGVDRTAAHEANRSDAAIQTQRYLKTIQYGNAAPYFPDWSPDGEATPLPANWHFQVVFDYGDHQAAAPTPTPDHVWAPRPDPFSVFRAGFELRTYRRCQRVLLFHDFPDEADVGSDCLVRSTDFVYSDETTPGDPRNPIYTFLESAAQVGYRRQGDGYDQRATPPLEFFYSQPILSADVLTLSDADSRANLPEGLDGSRFQWVDLDGEGISGILTDQNGEWGYKRNLGPINPVTLPDGRQVLRAQFGPLEKIPTLPVPASLQGGQQLLDLSGGGRLDLVAFDSPAPGYFKRVSESEWQPFRTFAALPRLNWSEPNLKFVDLTGDGRADVLISEDDVYRFYASLGEDGFSEAEQVFLPSDEQRGARVVFADGTQTVSLADLSGDGLSDIVRVRNGEVCYWPNLGYGRFGAKVTMDNAPRFSDEERFDPRRVRFADVDGSGTTDLLYVGGDGVQVYFNQSGNAWADAHRLALFPGADALSSVQAFDLLGNGTAYLVWSSPLPGEAFAPLRYVDLMGSQKPHLLVQMRNNLGAETRISYAPSTRFYLEDKQAGRSWVTRLPFPVQVVERVEHYDWIGRSRFVSRYRYHHGYFDGEEREFRGFGRVEEYDTEEHGDNALFPNVDSLNEDDASFVPPIHTCTWYHTGAFFEEGAISQQYQHEYWTEPSLSGNSAGRAALLLDDSVFEDALSPDELREAYRALKGSILRIEVFAEDGTDRQGYPYTVTEQNFSVRRLQARGSNLYAVFLTHARETLTYHYERQPDDPRLTHDLTLSVDDFGNVVRSVSVAYGRRAGAPAPEPDLSLAFQAMLKQDQTRLHVSAVEHGYTLPLNRPDDAAPFDDYRAPLPAETISAELPGIAPLAGRFAVEDFTQSGGYWELLWNVGHDLPHEAVAMLDIEGTGAPLAAGRRIVEHTRIIYRADDLSGLLALNQLEAHALPGETYHLALTSSMITRLLGARVTDEGLIEGGYVQLAGDDGWWIPSGRVYYSPGDGDTPVQEFAEARAHFYQIRRRIDPFGAISRVDYDNYDLLPLASTDALGNLTRAANDYRVLHPFDMTDPNGNQMQIAFDCLGQVTGTAVIGKAGEGDSLAGFTPDLSDAQIEALRANPLASPDAILGNATSRIAYDLFAYFRTRDLAQPDAPMVYTLSRETHVSDGASSLYQHVFDYSDGFGRAAQHKAQAEQVPVPDVGEAVAPRWVGSGWTIYNNKGKPVRKYEPFFSATHWFEFNRQAGVSSVLFYDPAERVIGTLHPNNSFEKTVFDAWRQETWDANDTVLIGDPRGDDHLGDEFKRLLGSAAFVSWHDQRIGGTLGDTPEAQSANQDAAQKAAAHAQTFTVVHFDSLGRACLSVADNGASARYPSRTALDTESKPLVVFDAGGRHVLEFCLREALDDGFQYVAGYDLAGNALYHNGMDGGERRSLSSVVGSPLRSWDARGFAFRSQYDALRRPTHQFVTPAGADEILIERLIYGEQHPDASRNLKGRLFRHYDAAGVASSERYDFKGNLVESGRQFARHSPATQAAAYSPTPDWSPINQIVDAVQLDSAAAPLLIAADQFTASSRFDALNRPIQLILPQAAGGSPSVVQPVYNEASLLERLDVWVRLASAPATLLDASSASLHAITNLDYNARGQRTELALGSGTITTYDYDPLTFQLVHLTTTRSAAAYPDDCPAAPRQGWPGRQIQNLSYCYDPVGNLTRMGDEAQQTIFFNNQRVEPSGDYSYDPLYRLTRATGREHLGQAGGIPAQVTHDDSPRMNDAPDQRILSPSDGQAMATYTESYAYDPVGNLLSLLHQVANGQWTQFYAYREPSAITPAELSNRLSATSLPGDADAGPYSAQYRYDAHGSMIQMPHLPVMTWDEHDRLQSTTTQVVNAGMPETTYYCYDAAGQRLRKVTYRKAASGQTPTRKSERLYLGTVELYREFGGDGSTITLERETLHVMDDKDRVGIVETRTAGSDPAPAQMIRYQYGNHLGSALMELDDQAAVISYEEYFPYGSTAYQAVRSQTQTPKRYRYTGKERDEESDLYYHGARYYAPWLGRWTACDPAGMVDNTNLFVYVNNNPVNKHDPTGHFSVPTKNEITETYNREKAIKAAWAGSYYMTARSNYGSVKRDVTETYAKLRGTHSYHRPRVQSVLGGAFLRMYLEHKKDPSVISEAGKEIQREPEFKKLQAQIDAKVKALGRKVADPGGDKSVKQAVDNLLQSRLKKGGIAFKYETNAVIGGVTGANVDAVKLEPTKTDKGVRVNYEVDVTFKDTYDFENKRTGTYDAYRKELAGDLAKDNYDKFWTRFEQEAGGHGKTKLDDAAVFGSFMYAIEKKGWTPGGLDWDVTIPVKGSVLVPTRELKNGKKSH